MSRVIIDSKPGEALYVIEGFHASPKGEMQCWETAHEFLPGMRVKYKSFRWNEARSRSDPESLKPTWLITFDHGGVPYEATQDYFMTQEQWAKLAGLFGGLKKKEARADKKYARWRDVAWLGATILLMAFAYWICTGLLWLLVVR